MRLAELPIEQISLGTRYREQMGDVYELSEDIKRNGIIHPIAVRQCDSDGSSTFMLLAGGRRLAATKLLKWELVPCRIYDSEFDGLTQEQQEHQLRCIELSENLNRKGMEWQEQTDLMRRIHELHIAIHGEKTSTAPDAPGWSMHKTATAVGKTTAAVSQDIQLAKAREQFPDLFSQCKNKAEAQKVLRSVGKAVISSEKAKEFKKESASIKQLALADSYIIADFFVGVKQIPDNSIHLVELDPPYAIGLDELKKSTDTIIAYNEVEPHEYQAFIDATLSECYRVMAKNSWLILWYAIEPWHGMIREALIEHGFKLNSPPAIWAKNSGKTLNTGLKLSSNYEPFFYAYKGVPEIQKQGRSNIFQFETIPPQKKVHPTERPIEMIQEVLTTFAKPDSNILVPFLGSGNTLLAAQRAGMKGIGFELSPTYKDSFIVKLNRLSC